MNFLFRTFAKRYLFSEWSAVEHRIYEILEEIHGTEYDVKLSTIDVVLVLAEDRRFLKHSGVDWIGTLRAAFRTYIFKDIQGASTITQQLVRTITGDYRISLKRKAKEIMLSMLVDAKFDKTAQVKAYLWIAYFGWNMNGIRQAMNRLNLTPPFSASECSQLIARLKYPEPRSPSLSIANKIKIRELNLLRLYEQHANNEK